MEGELAALMDMFHAVKRAGRSATLTLSTNSGKATQVKLAIELDDALPPPSTSSTPATAASASTPASGRRHHRGPAKKAKAKARAAKHRASLAAAASPTYPGGDQGAPPSQIPPTAPAQGLLPPQPPAQPSPNRHLVTKLRRRANTWSALPQLDGEGEESKSSGEEISEKVLHCNFCDLAPSFDDNSNSKVNANCTRNFGNNIGICQCCYTLHFHDSK